MQDVRPVQAAADCLKAAEQGQLRAAMRPQALAEAAGAALMGCGVAGVLAMRLCVRAGLLGVLDAVGAMSPCAVLAVGVLARWSGAIGGRRFRGGDAGH